MQREDSRPETGTTQPKSDTAALLGTHGITNSNDAALHHLENKYSVATRGGPSSGFSAAPSWRRFGLA